VNAAHARDCVRGKFSVAQFRACMDGKAVGALRASLGVATSEADIDRLLELVAELTGREVRLVTSSSGRRPL
jgi:selenocysteine lyase/cysteine desulfurase